ncbi:MAG: preprotein translocase subunit SecE [Anaerolineaceae bacterium]|nr:preprotein translocase subunit SecE [Anaerolineaceae bacterium]
MAKSKSRSNTPPPTTTREINPVVKYFNETRAELRKVTWPTRDETKNLTIIIVAVTVAMALFLGTLDYLFQVVAAGVISGDPIRIVIAIVLFAIAAAAFYFNNQEL